MRTIMLFIVSAALFYAAWRIDTLKAENTVLRAQNCETAVNGV